MDFLFTPEEAQATAEAVARYYRQKKYSVKHETPVADDAPLRPTLIAEAAGLHVIIEAQGDPEFGDPQRDLARWLAAKRMNCEMYLATSENSKLGGKLLKGIHTEGVGLLLVDESGGVTHSRQAANPALMITPDPALALGTCKSEIGDAVKAFNEGDRKAALRDLCEIVERETDSLARKAARKGWLSKSEADVSEMNWSNQIDVLAATSAYAGGKPVLVSQTLKDDLHSFRGARNLVDHKARNRREVAQRERQFAERAMSAPRLVADLLALRRQVK